MACFSMWQNIGTVEHLAIAAALLGFGGSGLQVSQPTRASERTPDWGSYREGLAAALLFGLSFIPPQKPSERVCWSVKPAHSRTCILRLFNVISRLRYAGV
jgi:hypothetical protein